ncbi:hypothetical protein [Glaciimonas sp. PCH181]|uniref:hypothetical protein n=1 Tax=Glaciimonas sp. PCH181 TaxID=2133943 RepID=UPI000D3610F7|nr:hypothetical protein [Glaciimonas sp. PCH181]PUA16962.1 hypothetical protein C7W93_13390 [Glaciimonas sp. PCH181]
MASEHSNAGSRFGLESTPSSMLLRFGKRELFLCRDYYKRSYRSNPLIECCAGVQPGHLQILLFRRWLVVMSKSH